MLKTPELAEAARVTIKRRMNPPENWEDTGWARCMLMLYSARLKDAEWAFEHIQTLQMKLTNNNLMVKHPPTRGAPSFADVYELDGNTGFTACVAEMLIQSHRSETELLPALPKAWKSGRVKGLCARGGFVVDLEWKENILTHVRIHAKVSSVCRLRYGKLGTCFNAEAGKPTNLTVIFHRLHFPAEYNLWIKPARVTVAVTLLLITGHNASGIIRMSVRPFTGRAAAIVPAHHPRSFWFMFVLPIIFLLFMQKIIL